nr:HNH endonuclease [Burkholderiaceae bacterium]
MAYTFSDPRHGSRHARGYGAAWDRLRQLVLRRDAGICQCEDCRRTGMLTAAHEVDHIVPKAEGGTDELD